MSVRAWVCACFNPRSSGDLLRDRATTTASNSRSKMDVTASPIPLLTRSQNSARHCRTESNLDAPVITTTACLDMIEVQLPRLLVLDYFDNHLFEEKKKIRLQLAVGAELLPIFHDRALVFLPSCARSPQRSSCFISSSTGAALQTWICI
jgi:hypothetical protein